MFDAIAARYDLLNHLLSAGIDRRWRRRAIRSLSLTGREQVLDLCTGTADLAIAAIEAQPPARGVVGVDFAQAMLRVGQAKILRDCLSDRIELLRGDATRIPVRDGAVDAITIGFGIRNVENTAAACDDAWSCARRTDRDPRVRNPVNAWRAHAYAWHFNSLLPLIGRIVSPFGSLRLPAGVGWRVRIA